MEGDAQRSFLYNLETASGLPAALAELMEAGGDPIDNGGPLESGHYDRCVAEMSERCLRTQGGSGPVTRGDEWMVGCMWILQAEC